jgi:PadR family transcriptional regulator
MTYVTATILQAVASGYRYGFDIIDATGLPGGTVYPALRRLENAGHLSASWEKERIARAEPRPPRRYYEMTRAGRAALAEAARRYRLADQAPPAKARPRSSRA